MGADVPRTGREAGARRRAPPLRGVSLSLGQADVPRLGLGLVFQGVIVPTLPRGKRHTDWARTRRSDRCAPSRHEACLRPCVQAGALGAASRRGSPSRNRVPGKTFRSPSSLRRCCCGEKATCPSSKAYSGGDAENHDQTNPAGLPGRPGSWRGRGGRRSVPGTRPRTPRTVLEGLQPPGRRHDQSTERSRSPATRGRAG